MSKWHKWLNKSSNQVWDFNRIGCRIHRKKTFFFFFFAKIVECFWLSLEQRCPSLFNFHFPTKDTDMGTKEPTEGCKDNKKNETQVSCQGQREGQDSGQPERSSVKYVRRWLIGLRMPGFNDCPQTWLYTRMILIKSSTVLGADATLSKL